MKRSRGTFDRYTDLTSFGKSSMVSQRGMQGLLRELRESGMPEAFSRSTQYRARKAVCATDTPYGPLVTYTDVVGTFKQDTGGAVEKTFTIGFQNPLAFLWTVCSQSQHYEHLLRAACETNPSSPEPPWRIILYSDGVDPSDTAVKTHSRKFIIFYWSFLELGTAALAHEAVWGTSTIVRESCAKSLHGGIAGLTSLVLEQFTGADFDIMRAGVSVTFANGERLRLFARVGVMLADEPAFKDMLDCKGHAGLKPCFLCQNCLPYKAPARPGALPLHLFDDGYAVTIAEPDFTKFNKHDDASIRETVARLARHKATLTVTEFEERSQLLGFNDNPRSIIANRRFGLGVVSMSMFDWSHTWICDGLADSEFGTFMQVMVRAKSSTTYAELGEYVKTFTLPRHFGTLNNLFEPGRYGNYVKTGSFPAIASEFLSLAPILRRYLSQVVSPRGEMTDHVASILAALDVIDMLQACKHLGKVRPSVLHAAITKHFELILRRTGRTM